MARLVFSGEQEDFRSSIRKFLDARSPSDQVRRLMDTEDGFDPEVWKQMAGQLGLQSLVIPEEYGGAGFSWVEQLIVFEEMGRSLLCAPIFSTVALATSALLASQDVTACKELLPAIASGERVATLAVAEDSGQWTADSITLDASLAGSTWRLDGTKSYVLDGALADLILVVGRTDRGLSLFAVEDNDAVNRKRLATLDQTRKQARLEFFGTSARLVGEEGAAGATLSKTLDHAAVALAAEQVGGAQRCLDMSVEYAKQRHQFGRPIGSFQAIKHICADMLLDVELARSAAYHAAWLASEDDPELPVAASMAKAFCSEAYFRTAAANIQVHGGIGFTWEHDAHLYFKRAKSSELLFGAPTFHRELLMQRLGM